MLEDLPNIGKAMAGDFRLLGIEHPHQFVGRDPYRLYGDLCAATGARHDPCVIDAFISAVRFMEGAPRTPGGTTPASASAALAEAPDHRGLPA